ncbi:MAG: hypothetical protein NZM35_07545 [Chitinophagales bacterium]|nr:hypothetical protein [Chitinophagales bacterium]MDW8419111.1 hypothetical protein [Chitinophagales bacterium]
MRKTLYFIAGVATLIPLILWGQAEVQNLTPGNHLFWRIAGNSATIDGTHFIGTTDNVPLNFRINNIRAGRITNATTGQTFYGFQAGNSVTGINNTLIGTNAGQNLTTGNENVGIGAFSLTGGAGATSSANTAVGFFALHNTTTGNHNTAVGHFALGGNTTGILNSAFGAGSMDLFQSGSYNSAIGFWSMRGQPGASGSYNSAIGYQSLYSVTSGSYNTALGVFALRNLTAGNYNVAVGDSALFLFSSSTGTNTAIGHAALRNTTSGTNNTALGNMALYHNSSGSNNTAIGHRSGINTFFNQNNTLVGANTTASLGLSYAGAIGADASVTTDSTIILGSIEPSIRVGIGTTSVNNRYKLYVRKVQHDPIGDGQHIIFSFRDRSSAFNGFTYAIFGSNTAVAGYNFWGDEYSFGVGGFTWNDFTRNGGVLGANQDASYWGSLGYRTSGYIDIGVYGTSSATGFGFLPDGHQYFTGIGGAFYGGSVGSWSRGEVMGQITAGELFSSYNLGNEYTSGFHADVVQTGDRKIAAFPVTGSDLKVYTDGSATINGVSVFVPFDEKFKSLIRDVPIVTVTPVGEAAPLYIASVSKEGFTVACHHSVNVQFNWMATGKRVDAEKVNVPADILDPTFDTNLKKVLFNENNREQSGMPIWYDGKKVRFDKAPERKLERKPE